MASVATRRGNAEIGMVRAQSALPTTWQGTSTRTAADIAIRQSVARLPALPLDTLAVPRIGYVFPAGMEKCVRRTRHARMRSAARSLVEIGINALQVGS